MKYAYLLAKVYRHFKEAEVNLQVLTVSYTAKCHCSCLMQQHMLGSSKLLIQKSLLTIALASQECRDAWIKNSRDLQVSKAKAPFSGSQNGSIPFLISMETVMGQMIHISTNAAF